MGPKGSDTGRQRHVHSLGMVGCWLALAMLWSTLTGCEPTGAGPQAKAALRFAVAADGHYGQEGTPFADNYADLIRAINQVNGERPLDFVVLLGDLVHDRPDLLPEVKRLLGTLAPPYFVVHGNHDHSEGTRWQALWGTPLDAVVLVKGYRLLLVNTAGQDGSYQCADRQWLHASLARPGSEELIAFAHISQKDWTRFGKDCPEIMDLFTASAKLKAVFHGHDHDVAEVKMEKNLPFVFTGRFGGSWGGDRQFLVVEMGDQGRIKILRYDLAGKGLMAEPAYELGAITGAKR